MQPHSCCIAATSCLHNFSFILVFIGVIVRFNFASGSSFKLSFQFVDIELVNHIEPPLLVLVRRNIHRIYDRLIRLVNL